MKWYQTKWWYVEGPHFPYILLLGWPFVWVWGFVHDLIDRRRERLWEPVPANPDGPALILAELLWDLPDDPFDLTDWFGILNESEWEEYIFKYPDGWIFR